MLHVYSKLYAVTQASDPHACDVMVSVTFKTKILLLSSSLRARKRHHKTFRNKVRSGYRYKQSWHNDASYRLLAKSGKHLLLYYS